ncbi:FusB/FusC family EF-G-binding protein [Paenibacillus nasutitermitis]|uniref:Elongation factor G-binding protein n=1 Tax=Paenibacillus nasutitermitis TaxID=1652958 RepID=A0A917DPS8_9BACL|nr:FusB/FusC family EF-G-binding protein [Paenibacillus nasutitermitis]GGD58403.1 elongation factor G-binding protein [Paenibacillus nasutitermitis]
MIKPFIRNHDYNFIKKQAAFLKQTLRTAVDPKVLESVRYSTESNIMGRFPLADAHQQQLLKGISGLDTADEFDRYLGQLQPYVVEFPTVTAKQIQKLFPKNKKLKIPDLSAVSHRHTTYLSWLDISTNKMFLVHEMNGLIMGVEGRFIPSNKKSYCFLCNRHEELVFFSAVATKRPAKSSPDYYKAIGNYLCMNSMECNKNVTDLSALEKFMEAVTG